MRLVTVKKRELTPSAATEASAEGGHGTCTGGASSGRASDLPIRDIAAAASGSRRGDRGQYLVPEVEPG
jgi:hypothetical protein